MKIVVVTGSPHKAGTSALLADKFIEGAQSKGHEVFRFNAAFEDIHPCRGCDACGMNGPCVQKDAIEEKLIHKLTISAFPPSLKRSSTGSIPVPVPSIKRSRLCWQLRGTTTAGR